MACCNFHATPPFASFLHNGLSLVGSVFSSTRRSKDEAGVTVTHNVLFMSEAGQHLITCLRTGATPPRRRPRSSSVPKPTGNSKLEPNGIVFP